MKISLFSVLHLFLKLCNGAVLWRGLSLNAQLLMFACSRDQDKPEVPAVAQINNPKKQSIFSMRRCKSISYTNSWRYSAGHIGINHIHQDKTGPAWCRAQKKKFDTYKMTVYKVASLKSCNVSNFLRYASQHASDESYVLQECALRSSLEHHSLKCCIKMQKLKKRQLGKKLPLDATPCKMEMREEFSSSINVTMISINW